MSRAVSRRDIARLVTRRLLDEPERRGHWLRVLAAFLIEHKMLQELDLLVTDISYELYRQAGILTVDVVSARQLGAELRKEIGHYLQTKTGARTVTMHGTIDETLLGGFVARTADAEIDASVRTKLRALGALA